MQRFEEVRNGQVWRKEFARVIIQWLGGDMYMILSRPNRADHGGSCMVPMGCEPWMYGGGAAVQFYTANGLWRALTENGWELTVEELGLLD